MCCSVTEHTGTHTHTPLHKHTGIHKPTHIGITHSKVGGQTSESNSISIFATVGQTGRAGDTGVRVGQHQPPAPSNQRDGGGGKCRAESAGRKRTNPTGGWRDVAGGFESRKFQGLTVSLTLNRLSDQTYVFVFNRGGLPIRFPRKESCPRLFFSFTRDSLFRLCSCVCLFLFVQKIIL